MLLLALANCREAAVKILFAVRSLQITAPPGSASTPDVIERAANNIVGPTEIGSPNKAVQERMEAGPLGGACADGNGYPVTALR